MEEKSVAKEMLVKKIKNYIALHQAEELSLNKIGAELNYSKFYMERVFAETTGMTIYKYIRMCRLDAAAKQLVQTDRPIIDIALEAGYNSPQAFTQAFRRIYLCPPRIYRKNGALHPKKSRISMLMAGAACMGIDKDMGYTGRRKQQGAKRYAGIYRCAAPVLHLSMMCVRIDAVYRYPEQSPDCLHASGIKEGRWAA